MRIETGDSEQIKTGKEWPFLVGQEFFEISSKLPGSREGHNASSHYRAMLMYCQGVEINLMLVRIGL